MTLRSVGLFAGIGGIERGLETAGFDTELLCEINPTALAVLRARFPGVQTRTDVREVAALPKVDLVAAGFPCQDLSQAGRKQGIGGAQSGLVNEVFRLCARGTASLDWLLLENVSYMLRLDAGRGMLLLVSALEEAGFRWAYRVVDARAFGVPQRRQRVLFLASRRHDPRAVLFADDHLGPGYDDRVGEVDPAAVYGFYWTEGLRGLGWARNAVPTVKGGSALGIPSPPAVWVPSTGEVGTPQIEDAERLQGFPQDWTYPAVDAGFRTGRRWQLVGNAVCVDMAAWVGSRLVEPGTPQGATRPLPDGARWPGAAWGEAGRRCAVEVGMLPFRPDVDLRSFLTYPLKPLSRKATLGFLSRARRSRLRFADGFLDALDAHLGLEPACAGLYH